MYVTRFLEKGRLCEVLTVELHYQVNKDAGNGREVVKEGEPDEGRGPTRKQEASKIREGNNWPTVQHEDQHRVQEVEILHEGVHSAVLEHHLQQKQSAREGKGRTPCHQKSSRNADTASAAVLSAQKSSLLNSVCPLKKKTLAFEPEINCLFLNKELSGTERLYFHFFLNPFRTVLLFISLSPRLKSK